MCRIASVWTVVCLGLLATCGVLATAGQPPEEARVVWIYRDVPSPGEADPRSAPELLFKPFFIYPADVSNDIALNDRLPLNQLEANRATGTCCEFVFRLTGA